MYAKIRGATIRLAALRARFEAPVHAVHASRVADRGDAVREPEFVDVFRWGALVDATLVCVGIHEAGQEVHPGGVDFLRGALRTTLRPDGYLGVADGRHRRDPVVLDDHVRWAERRRAGAVDDGHATDDQLREGPFALAGLSVGRLLNGTGLGNGRAGRGEGGKKASENEAHRANILLTHAVSRCR